ncbi:MAG: hypothetical protein ACK4RK_00110 [Gemmataceae bacterium]
MSHMFEVYYPAPPNGEREATLTTMVSSSGGQLSFREEPLTPSAANPGPKSVCLTFEFLDLSRAEKAAETLRPQEE